MSHNCPIVLVKRWQRRILYAKGPRSVSLWHKRGNTYPRAFPHSFLNDKVHLFSRSGFLDKNNDSLNRNLKEVRSVETNKVIVCYAFAEWRGRVVALCWCVVAWFGFCAGHVPVRQPDPEALFQKRGSDRPETPRNGESFYTLYLSLYLSVTLTQFFCGRNVIKYTYIKNFGKYHCCLSSFRNAQTQKHMSLCFIFVL